MPKAILREFCISGETILRLRRNQGSVEPEEKSIDRVFQRFHFNSLQSDTGQRNDSLEKFFANHFDTFIPHWINIFRQAAKSGEVAFESDGSRDRFVQFFYNHMKRTPDFLEPIVERVARDVFSEEAISDLEDKYRPLTNEEKHRFSDPEWRDTVLSNSRVHNIGRQSEKVLDTLYKMKIIVAVPKRTQKRFIASSNPVARFEDRPYQNLGSPGVELWTTLTPNLAVGFVHSEVQESFVTVTDKSVRKLNLTLTGNSRSIAGNSRKLLASLARAAW